MSNYWETDKNLLGERVGYKQTPKPDLKQLRAVAEKAVNLPWEQVNEAVYQRTWPPEFRFTFDPHTVLWLIERVERLREHVKHLDAICSLAQFCPACGARCEPLDGMKHKEDCYVLAARAALEE